MAHDEELAGRIRVLISGEPVVERRMFGGLAFLLGGHLSVAASGQGGLMVRVPPEQTAELLEEPGATEFEMRGRTMKGWLRVDDAVLRDEEVLAQWVTRGLDYAGSLPPK